MSWITIALLGRVRGNRGELTAVPLSDKPERFERLKEVTLFPRDAQADSKDGSKFEVESVWQHVDRLIFKFRGVDSISDAEPWQGSEVRVPAAERVELEPGEYFQSDLIGCEVRDRSSGDALGKVTAWQDGGGAGLLEIEGGLLIPFAREICIGIDVAAKRILVDLPEGLKDLNPS
ncbi:MAG: ribosome maturation factor RimM [Acidobacteriota bacterium]|nr:ribosome maturation factor RimM [Acidobacteriota bacterium]